MVIAKVKCSKVKALGNGVEVKFETEHRTTLNKKKITSQKIVFYNINAIDFFKVNDEYEMIFRKVK